ncbi:MAG TPA: hypothetical protein VGR31_08330 [Planctomycetota bacterium]|jgi:hypothetical protein|nr:hypothetical protein [Planctomycetota bacterium]
MRSERSARVRRAVVGSAVLVLLTACAGVSFERTTETSGTFSSYGLAFTILSSDFPKGAMQIARENASDANLANMEIKKSIVTPYLGPFDWLLDIVGIRYARISGTWGFAATQ